jgi:hypothetical protein
MKATLELLDPIYNEVKARARKEDKTFRAKVEELLRLGLEEEKNAHRKKKPFKLNIPSTKGGLLIDLNDKDALYEILDEKFIKTHRK